MRRLFLIRHAKTQPSIGRNDYERTLTDRGRADARRVAAALAGRRVLPDVLVHSGATRAKETAEIFAGAWPRGVELQEDPALYDATEIMLFARARTLSNAHARVGLVGHNPGLGELAVALTGSGAHPELRRLAAKYPTGAPFQGHMSRMGWTGRAPAPNGSQSARGACQEKEHRHASPVHRSGSDHHRNRYG